MPSSAPDLPDAGARRWWNIEHNPKSATKPLKIELRESLEGVKRPTKGLSRLIGQGTSAAQPTAVREEAERILVVAARVDEFVGAHTGRADLAEAEAA